MVLKYLNGEALASNKPEVFWTAKPYPWANPHGLLTEWGYETLAVNMPNIAFFEKDYGYQRKFGQTPHDRYRFWYNKTKGDIPKPWEEFISELHGPEYRRFIQEHMGVEKFDLRLEWHYTEGGCSISPHIDGVSTIGTHLFYFNLPGVWDEAWGGGTLVLDDGGKGFPPQSSPTFEDFNIIKGKHVGNYSSLFKNQDNAWHGVKELTSPPGVFRQLFTIFIEEPVSPMHKYILQIKKPIRMAKSLLKNSLKSQEA